MTARIFASSDGDDTAWTLEAILLADVRNMLAMFIWSLGNPKKRGAKPSLIGPSWMRKDNTRRLDTQVMTIDELMNELGKPRG